MKRPRQHIIDAEAEKIFRSSVPSTEWLIRDIGKNDYGIDFELEYFNDKKSTGIIIKVQLKGTENLKINKSGSFISRVFDIDNIKYYLEEINIPLIIVIVDIELSKIYWHNPKLDDVLQNDYLEAMKNKQKSVSLRINTTHILPNDFPLLKYEYYRTQTLLSANTLSRNNESYFSEILGFLDKEKAIGGLQNKIEIVKLAHVRDCLEKFNPEKFNEILARIDSLIISADCNLDTKYQAMLYRKETELKKDIHLNQGKNIDKIYLDYALRLKKISDKGPAHLRMISLALHKTAKLQILVNREYNIYLNLKIKSGQMAEFWKYSVLSNRIMINKKIQILFKQLDQLIFILIKLHQAYSLPSLIREIILSFNKYIVRLRSEKLNVAANVYWGKLFDLIEVAFRVIEFYKLYEMYEVINFIVPAMNYENEIELNKELEKAIALILDIKHEEYKIKTKKEFVQNVNEYRNISSKKGKEFSIKDEIEFYKEQAKTFGVDLDDQEDEISRIVNIGILDLNPERILKKCSYLYVRGTGHGLVAEMLHLPTAGFKRLVCTKLGYSVEGLSLDSIYQSIEKQFCSKCISNHPHPPNWKWSRKWQREQDKIFFNT